MPGRRTFDPATAKAMPPVNGRPEAACYSEDPNLFYPDHPAANVHAIVICHTCPFEDECLVWALDTNQSFGVWGGKSPDERRAILTRRRLRRTVFDQGVTA